MTDKEEDILTSQNLIKKGVVLDKLLEALIVTLVFHWMIFLSVIKTTYFCYIIVYWLMVIHIWRLKLNILIVHRK